MRVRLDTIDDLNAQFTYEPDGIDGWSYGVRGDCDDYALTAAFIRSNGSWTRFWFNVLTFKHVFCMVHTGSARHLVLYERGKGYIDNIMPAWRKRIEFKPVFPWIVPQPVILFKIIVGKFFD